MSGLSRIEGPNCGNRRRSFQVKDRGRAPRHPDGGPETQPGCGLQPRHRVDRVRLGPVAGSDIRRPAGPFRRAGKEPPWTRKVPAGIAWPDNPNHMTASWSRPLAESPNGKDRTGSTSELVLRGSHGARHWPRALID